MGEDKEERDKERRSVWKKQRKAFYEKGGVSVECVRRKRIGEEIEGWLKERDIEMQEQDRFERTEIKMK